MRLRFVVAPPLTDELCESVIELWTEVAAAGGAVGFAGPVTRTDVEPVARGALSAVADGHDLLLAGYVGDKLTAMLFLVSHRFALQRHWRTVKRVMVHPGAQRNGYGAQLMREGERIARAHGYDALHLTVREGTGVEEFYAVLGYQEVGRFPRALRLGPGDDRDEIQMWLPLGTSTRTAE
ncbi:MAG TPA: GNAT family N-acetyltransferase [Rugosimonospora sp.]|nr:GNAT family N-acetyltransferase [Rugosimonospora sp.]